MAILLSNERNNIFRRHLQSAESGGGYLGVGFLQNLTYLAEAQHTFAILIDLDPEIPVAFRNLFYKILEMEDHEIFLRWWSSQKGGYFRAYHEFALQYDPANWLLDSKRYAVIRKLVSSGSIHLIHGDIGEANIQETIVVEARNYPVPIVHCYLSNILSITSELKNKNFNYTQFRKLFDSDCFFNGGICFLTSEFLPPEFRQDQYHYSILSLPNFKKLLNENGSVREYLAYFLALIMATDQKKQSIFLEPISVSIPDFVASLDKGEIDLALRQSPAWPAWQNFKRRFF